MIRTLLTAGIAMMAVAQSAPIALVAQEVIDLPGRDQRLDAEFEEVFRVGVLDGEDWEMLGVVTHVEFDENGNLYIVDGSSGGGMSFGGDTRVVVGLSSDERVLVFNASGDFLREFGTSGEGPGEFNRPAGFAVLRDGTTVVRDMGHGAYQLFDNNGAFLRMVRVAAGGGVRGFSGGLLGDPRGNAVFTVNPGLGSLGSGGGDAPPPTSRPITRLGLAGEEVRTDTVVEAWLPPREQAGIKVPGNIDVPGEARKALANALSGLSQPSVFEPAVLAGVLPNGGIVYSDSSGYSLKVIPPDEGEVTRIIRRPIEPEPVTPRIEKQHRERQEAAREAMGGSSVGVILQSRTVTGGGGVNPGASNQSFALDMPEPTYYPEISVLRDLSTTWDGSIWVRRRGDEPESDGPIDVVTSDGRYVGTFPKDVTEIPDAFGPNGLAAFIELDDFDVARVVVRRLPVVVR
ncbi:MAG: 6-bladed beta-propeller [Gemmatimonadota bacterium]|nr:6-bladed beta-propeller [Gemmatimonadota bacterium]